MKEPPVTMKMNVQIQEEAATWFVEFNEGEVPLETRREFARWLRASPEHVRTYLQVSATFEDLGRLGNHRTGGAQALIDRALAEGNVVELENRRTGETAARRSENTPPVRVSPSRTRRWGSFLGQRTPLPPPGMSGRDRRTTDPDGLDRARGVGSGRLLAAGVAVVALGLGAVVLWWNSQQGLYSTATGEQRIVNLSDGSTIELNAESRLRVRLRDHERFVDLLQGQALFHVAKDAQRPFIVRSGTASVRAVGTRFDVNRLASDTVITVLEGRVAIARTADALSPGAAETAAPTESTPLYASAGEQVILTAQAASKPDHPDVSAATAWRERKLIFSSSPLPVVVGEYNRYHEKRLVIADPSLSDFRISGVFYAADATSLLAFLRAQSNIEVDEQEREIVLKAR
jgi:transmembrane sensor